MGSERAEHNFPDPALECEPVRLEDPFQLLVTGADAVDCCRPFQLHEHLTTAY